MVWRKDQRDNMQNKEMNRMEQINNADGRTSGTEISLKDIKLLLLEMLDEIDAFCAKENIEYYLVGGSMLGAVRHNGFIPWDDDVDIGMPRADYERFVTTFISKTGVTKVVDYRNTRKYAWPFAKAIHTKTRLIETGCEQCEIGVYIDIFPLDAIEGTYEAVCKTMNRVKLYKNALTLKHLKFEKRRSFWKNMAILSAKVLYLVPDAFFIKTVNDIASKKNTTSNYNYVCNFMGAWGKKEIITADCFAAVVKYRFEEREYCILREYDKYLSALYGDYMTPPPVEKQVSHHSYVAYWK